MADCSSCRAIDAAQGSTAGFLTRLVHDFFTVVLEMYHAVKTSLSTRAGGGNLSKKAAVWTRLGDDDTWTTRVMRASLAYARAPFILFG